MSINLQKQISDAENAALEHDRAAAEHRKQLAGLEAELRVRLASGGIDVEAVTGRTRDAKTVEAEIAVVENEVKAAERRARVCREGVAELKKALTAQATAKRHRDAHEAGKRVVDAAEQRVALLAEVDKLFDAIGAKLRAYDQLGAGQRRDLEELSAVAHETHPYGDREHARVMERLGTHQSLGSALCSALMRADLSYRAGGMVDVGRPVEPITLAQLGAMRADSMAREVAALRAKVAA